MGEQFDKAISLNELCKASKRTAKGVGHKQAVMLWKIERLERCEKLKYSITSGRHRTGHGLPFKIYEPKERLILTPLYCDRVWQNDMCYNGVYDDMTTSLIYDSGACQKEKGTEFSILRMTAVLEKYYRKYGDNNGIAKHLDIKSYFPSTPNRVAIDVIERYCNDEKIVPFLVDVFNSFIDNRDPDVIAADPFGKRGTGLGSPVSQLIQLAILDDLDHKLTNDKNLFAVHRTMDDIVIIARDKDAVRKAEETVREYLAERGLICTDKGGNNKLSKGFYFLKKKFVLTETGKVLVIPMRQKFEKERRVLRKQKHCLDAGMTDIATIMNKYECFISTMLICDCAKQIKKMDSFFANLFGTKPIYKCKRKSRRKNAMTEHINKNRRLRELETENERLKAENAEMKQQIEMINGDNAFMAMCLGVDLEQDDLPEEDGGDAE